MSSFNNIYPEEYLKNAELWRQLLVVTFKRNRPIEIQKQPSADSYYLNLLVRYLEIVAEHNPHLEGQILATIHDAIWQKDDNYPILCFGRPLNEQSCGLIPDPFYINSNGFLEDFSSLRKLDIDWKLKGDVAYFRGSSTGGHINYKGWRQNQRVKLCLLSLENPELLDAKITSIVQEEEVGVGLELARAGILSHFEKPEIILKYKYLIEIDGNANSWGFFLKLGTGSTILKVSSPWEQWFYDKLKPWHHFIPVEPDLSDLIEKISWLRVNDDKGRQIGQNGKELAYSLQFEQALKCSEKVIADMILRTPQQ